MPIFGVTHTPEGVVKQSLSIEGKVAIGLAPDEKAGRKAPAQLDHFVFLRKVQQGVGKTGEILWVPNDEIIQHYILKNSGDQQNAVSEKMIATYIDLLQTSTASRIFKYLVDNPEFNRLIPRRVDIVLIDDDPEGVFPTELAWWSASEKVCWGVGTGADGKSTATRRTTEHPEGEPWPGERKGTNGNQIPSCGDQCPDLKEGRCAPSADLRFWLADFPALGAVWRIHTSGYRSVRQIHSALMQMQRLFGGRLAGLRCALVVKPERSSYLCDGSRCRQQPGHKGQLKRHSTMVWALGLEMKGKDFRKMLGRATEYAQAFEQTRKLIGAGSMQVVERETERAPEISAEFAPGNVGLEEEVIDVEVTEVLPPPRAERTPEPTEAASAPASATAAGLLCKRETKDGKPSLLHIGGPALFRLAAQLRAVGSKPAGEGVLVRAEFGSYLLDELQKADIHIAFAEPEPCWCSEVHGVPAEATPEAKPEAKPEPSAPSEEPQPETIRGVIVRVKNSEPDKKPHVKVWLRVEGESGDRLLFCWSTTWFENFHQGVGKVAEVVIQPAGQFVHIKDVKRIGDSEWDDGVPVKRW